MWHEDNSFRSEYNPAAAPFHRSHDGSVKTINKLIDR